MKQLTIIAYMEESYAKEDLFISLGKQEIFDPQRSDGLFREIPQIQCIVLDASGKKENETVLRQLVPEHVSLEYINCDGKNIAQCYNGAMEKITGEYVSFVDIDSRYSPKAIWHLCEILEDAEIPVENKKCVCIKPIYVRPDGMEIVYRTYPGVNGVTDISENASKADLCLYSYFIESSIAKTLSFAEQFPTECRTLYCMELMEQLKRYTGKNGPSIRYIHPLEDAKGQFEGQHHKEWYTATLLECYLPFIEKRLKDKRLTDATEAALLYLIYIRLSYNIGASDNEVLSEVEVQEFMEAVYKVCSRLSFDTLLLQNKVKNQKYAAWIMWELIEQKIKRCQYDYRISLLDGCVILRVTDETGKNTRYQLYNFNTMKATVSTIDYENHNLYLSFSFNMLPAVVHELKPEVSVTSGSIEETEIYNKIICFGKTVANPTIYRACVPVDEKKTFQQFRFQVKVNGETINLSCNFSKRPASRLTASCSENYWQFSGNRVIQYQPSKNRFIVEKCTQTELMVVEQNFCRAIKMDQTLTEKEKTDLIELRREYWKEKYAGTVKKPIWITYDKLYKGGDNGEYMFHYVREHCPDIDIYYFLTEQSADYERLKSDDHVLIHGSMEARLKVLQAQVILATHTNTMSGCGFTLPSEKRYLKNLYDASVVCIQHGLTVQDIAIWQNILSDNTKLYCCASQNEIKNIMQPEYGYSDKEIRLTGLARYDGLINNDQKQILITPTWRRNLVNAGSSGNVRAKNNFFKESEYFRIYNSLINDKRLIECAKKNHYRIMYLIHPTLSAQIDDFDKNDYVDIVAAAGDMSYEKVLTESSLMVTDYSGVQFDFAYMRKPILYYHPASLPPHYTESIAFHYDSMGFGPIIDAHDTLVDQICDYMENGCKINDYYRNRADAFFAFDDTDNCKRITTAVKQYTGSLEQSDMSDVDVCDKYDLIQEPGKMNWQQLLTKTKKSIPRRAINKAKRIVKKVTTKKGV